MGVDAIDYPQVSIVGDAREVLAAIESESIDAIFNAHFLEHLDDLHGMLGEMARVLKVGGELTVHVPHWANPGFWSDPTHRRAFGLYTFDYLAESRRYQRPVPDYGNRLPLRLHDVRLAFRVDPGFGVRTWIMGQVQRQCNRSPPAQEFFELNLAQIIGCEEIRFYLTRTR